jgi:hypothetical protein
MPLDEILSDAQAVDRLRKLLDSLGQPPAA